MNTNQRLINLVKAAAAPRHSTEEQREEARKQIEGYIVACSISRMPNADRAKVWRRKANARESELVNLYRTLTGKDFYDVCEQFDESKGAA